MDLVHVKAVVHTTRPLPGQNKVERKTILVSRSIAIESGFQFCDAAGKRKVSQWA
jgi:hypothetical protein